MSKFPTAFLIWILCLGSTIASESDKSAKIALLQPKPAVAAEGLLLTIELIFPKDRPAHRRFYMGGEVIGLNLTLKNLEKTDRVIVGSKNDIGSVLEVHDAKGQRVPQLRYGEWLEKSRRESRTEKGKSITLPPGKEFTFKMELSRQYDVTLTGRYTVTALLNVPKLNGAGLAEIKSNTLLIEVDQ